MCKPLMATALEMQGMQSMVWGWWWQLEHLTLYDLLHSNISRTPASTVAHCVMSLQLPALALCAECDPQCLECLL